jgi:hypothetical protein
MAAASSGPHFPVPPSLLHCPYSWEVITGRQPYWYLEGNVPQALGTGPGGPLAFDRSNLAWREYILYNVAVQRLIPAAEPAGGDVAVAVTQPRLAHLVPDVGRITSAVCGMREATVLVLRDMVLACTDFFAINRPSMAAVHATLEELLQACSDVP